MKKLLNEVTESQSLPVSATINPILIYVDIVIMTCRVRTWDDHRLLFGVAIYKIGKGSPKA